MANAYLWVKTLHIVFITSWFAGLFYLPRIYVNLADEKDRNLFYDFLITNSKLAFDEFEDSMSNMPPEPTTPEYEAEKAKKDAAVQGARSEGAHV